MSWRVTIFKPASYKLFFTITTVTWKLAICTRKYLHTHIEKKAYPSAGKPQFLSVEGVCTVVKKGVKKAGKKK